MTVELIQMVQYVLLCAVSSSNLIAGYIYLCTISIIIVILKNLPDHVPVKVVSGFVRVC